jgi:hypothetical protein
MKLLIQGGEQACSLLRRIASRRGDRCELSLISAMIYLLQEDRSLFVAFHRALNSTWRPIYQMCPDIRFFPGKTKKTSFTECSALDSHDIVRTLSTK